MSTQTRPLPSGPPRSRSFACIPPSSICAEAAWSEQDSPYRTVAHLTIPVQQAYTPTRAEFVDGDLSFSPAHTLLEHKPLGSINRARLAAYTALSTTRRRENDRPQLEPISIDQVPA